MVTNAHAYRPLVTASGDSDISASAGDPGRSTARGRRGRRTASIVLIVALIAVAAWLARWVGFHLTHSVTDDAFIEADLVELAPRVSGQIVEMLVQDNESVPAGAPLCRLDPKPYERKVGQDEAQLGVAEADLLTARSALTRLEERMPAEVAVAEQLLAVAESDQRSAAHTLDQVRDTVDHGIATAEQVVKAAEATRDFAKVTFDRWDELAKGNAVAREDRDAKERSLRTAVAGHEEALVRLEQARSDRVKVAIAEEVLAATERRVAQAQAQLRLAKLLQLDIDESRRKVASAEARVEAAKALRAVDELDLAYTTVVAPFDAVVARRFQFEGDHATPGVPIFSLYDHDDLFVTANMPETRLHGVAPGSRARLDVDAFDEPFAGRVLWVGRATGAQFALVPRNLSSGEFTKVVQRVPIRLLIDRDERWARLSPGLSVTVAISHEPPAEREVPSPAGAVDTVRRDGAAPGATTDAPRGEDASR